MSDRDLRNLYENVRSGVEYNSLSMQDLYTEVLGTVNEPYAKPTSVIPVKKTTKQDIWKLLQNLDSQKLLNQDDLSYIHKYLSIKPFKTKITQYLTSHNLSPTTIVEGNVIELIIQILSNNNDLQTYIDYIKSPIGLSDIPREGIMVDVMSKRSKLSTDTLRQMIELKGTESGRGVGKGEMGMAALFKDVSQGGAGEGDLVWNGKYLEVKGTDARLGKRDRAFGNFEMTTLGKMSIEHGITERALSVIISSLAQREKPDVVAKAIDEFNSMAYPNSGLRAKNFNFKTPEDARVLMNTVYFMNYANEHKVSSFIFINTSATKYYSRYIVFDLKDVPNLIKKRRIGAGVIKLEDLDPSIATI
tara:strand:- start:618 stop:1697 length:1080 start_codon:yes stop_codon:yes gene_type:complete